MKTLMKRSLALTVMLAVCISLFAAFAIGAGAASTSGDTVNYKYDGDYIYNWGEREEVASFLSPNAIAFYEKYSVTYEELASYKGGTSKSNVPSSEMYDELASLMANAHKTITSYNDTRSLYKYTDCENNGSRISSFYSGVLIGPSWDGGSTWNREHTWPNSKGEGSSENDIMMLRPTSVSENSSRGNKAYGESSGYYSPNKESNGEHDLRGDVARIFLYVYVRWGNSTNLSNAWGQSGVMESPEVMLKWMEEDPVDTWELGRNDSVQSITGTRNVFVDYPELAFILFGEEVPSDMQTPSGNAKNGTVTPPTTECNHQYTNACDTECNLCGYVRVVSHVYTNNCDTDCNVCGYVRVASHIYSYSCDTDCNNCGETRVANHIYGGWQIIIEATESASGLKSGKCIYCQKTTEREIPKLETSTDTPTDPDVPSDEIDCKNGKHAFGNWETNKDGKEERYCYECGTVEIKSDEKPKCEHTFTEWEENASGKMERYCTECGTVEIEPTECGTQNNTNSSTSSGFFAKIAEFFKNFFAKIFSIFNKNE